MKAIRDMSRDERSSASEMISARYGPTGCPANSVSERVNLQLHVGLLVGRACLSAVFLLSGLTKLLDWPAGVSEMAAFGLPSPPLTNAGVVCLQLGAGLGLALGVWARSSAAALALFTASATLLAHAFWTGSPADQVRGATVFLEHIAIVGGLIVLVAVGPGRLVVGRSKGELQ